jgi:hypothetical protein
MLTAEGARKLVHAEGDAKRFYEQLAAPVLIGMEATGNSQWFIELHAKAPSFPASSSSNKELLGFESSLRSYPISSGSAWAGVEPLLPRVCSLPSAGTKTHCATTITLTECARLWR